MQTYIERGEVATRSNSRSKKSEQASSLRSTLKFHSIRSRYKHAHMRHAKTGQTYACL